MYENKGHNINFPQNQWVQNQSFSKSVGAAAPTAPIVTKALMLKESDTPLSKSA